MTATTLEAGYPPQILDNVVEAAKPTTKGVLDTLASWARSMANGVKRIFSGLWSAVRSGARWLKDKVVAVARWVRDKTVAAYQWTRDRVVKPTARWVRDNAGRIKDKALEYAKRAWSWSKRSASRLWGWTRTTASRVWAWMAPARAWLSTPFNMTLGASGAMVLIWGKIALIAAVPLVLIALMLRGVGTLLKPKAEPVAELGSNIGVPADDAMIVLNDAQRQALEKLNSDARDAAESARDGKDKEKFSDYAAQMFLIERRIGGSTESTEQLYAEFKASQERLLKGAKAAAVFYNWNSVRSGLATAHARVIKILEANAAKELKPVS